MSMTTKNFGTQLEKRMDKTAEDVTTNVSNNLDSTPNDAEVSTADGVTGNGFGSFAPTVKPSATNAQGQSASVQHGPGASKVRP